MSQEINWSKAQELAKQEEIQKRIELVERAIRTKEAADELWEKMASKDFRYSDFEDIVNDNDVDEEDLLFDLM